MSTANTAKQHAPRLSDAQVEQYKREGYTICRDQVLSAKKFSGLVTHFEKLLAELPPDSRPENMDVPHFADLGLFEWLFDDEVLDLVEPLIGPDIALFSSHFLCKPPGDGKRVPWHEDSAYWGNKIAPMEVCTVWLALDRSDAGNSAMRIIPGSHLGKGGYSEYDAVPDPDRSVFATEIRPKCFDAKKAVTLELEPGQASLHHAKLMHGSTANTSNRRRCGYTMRYMSTKCLFNHKELGGAHQVYLARGKDHAGNVYGDPNKTAMHLLDARRHWNVRKGH